MYKDYEAVIGLEIHAQLKTNTKIFSRDATVFHAGDNENLSVVSAGLPGTLPVLNKTAVELAIKAGLALGCQIRNKSVFARKNYFYPDLPKGYQISQYDQPLCENGRVLIKSADATREVRIERAHMEEDAGKSTHFGEYTLINYNRAGVPLLEIVSAPDMRTPAEAAEYARLVRQILKYVDVCDGNLEEGSLRCDCNVSVRKKGDQMLGTKVEIKNVNSFRFVEKAIEYEIERQIEQLERNVKIIQETRLYDSDKNRTLSMRTKEDAQDYRYFPDPDLLPLIVTSEEIQKIRISMPELPAVRKLRFMNELALTEADAEAMSSERDCADYFEAAQKVSGAPKTTANWIMTELMRKLNETHVEITNSEISPQRLGELVKIIEEGAISGRIGKTVFEEMWSTKKPAAEIIKEKNLVQINDATALEKVVLQVLADNTAAVEEYKKGKTKLFGFFVGAIMKATKGQASPEVVNKLLTEKLRD